MNNDKLCVIFPGVGYHKDKPLLYYASRLASKSGYDILSVEYSNLPQKIKGDAEMMKKAAEIAYAQTVSQLKDTDLKGCHDILLIGKSIGTYLLAKYAADNDLKAKQLWYTPVEATFSFDSKNVLAFIGDADPWSDVAEVKRIAGKQNIPLHSYPDCNHSLECDDIEKNIDILKDVMNKTALFIA